MATFHNLLKNGYKKLNLKTITKFIVGQPQPLIAEDLMAKTVAYEILQDYASADLAKFLIERLQKEENINILLIINNTLSNIFSVEYKVESNLDEVTLNQMIKFWGEVYNFYKKKIFQKVALNTKVIKRCKIEITKKCLNTSFCEIEIKPMFISFTNKLFSRIKNFKTYNIEVYQDKKMVWREVFEKGEKDNIVRFSIKKTKPTWLEIYLNIDDKRFRKKYEIR
jgi:hypothetical protein